MCKKFLILPCFIFVIIFDTSVQIPMMLQRNEDQNPAIHAQVGLGLNIGLAADNNKPTTRISSAVSPFQADIDKINREIDTVLSSVQDVSSFQNADIGAHRIELEKIRKARYHMETDLQSLIYKLRALNDFEKYIEKNKSFSANSPFKVNIDDINRKIDNALLQLQKPTSPANADEQDLSNEIIKLEHARQLNDDDLSTLKEKINAFNNFEAYIAKRKPANSNSAYETDVDEIDGEIDKALLKVQRPIAPANNEERKLLNEIEKVEVIRNLKEKDLSTLRKKLKALNDFTKFIAERNSLISTSFKFDIDEINKEIELILSKVQRPFLPANDEERNLLKKIEEVEYAKNLTADNLPTLKAKLNALNIFKQYIAQRNSLESSDQLNTDIDDANKKIDIALSKAQKPISPANVEEQQLKAKIENLEFARQLKESDLATLKNKLNALNDFQQFIAHLNSSPFKADMDEINKEIDMALTNIIKPNFPKNEQEQKLKSEVEKVEQARQLQQNDLSTLRIKHNALNAFRLYLTEQNSSQFKTDIDEINNEIAKALSNVQKPISPTNDDEKKLISQIEKIERAKQLQGYDLPTFREKLSALHDFKHYLATRNSANSNAALITNIDEINKDIDETLLKHKKPLSPANDKEMELAKEIEKLEKARQLKDVAIPILTEKLKALNDFEQYIETQNSTNTNSAYEKYIDEINKEMDEALSKVQKPISTASHADKKLASEIVKIEMAKQLMGNDLPTYRAKLKAISDFKQYIAERNSSNSPFEIDINEINNKIDKALSTVQKPISPANEKEKQLLNEIAKLEQARLLKENDLTNLRNKINALDDFQQYIANLNAPDTNSAFKINIDIINKEIDNVLSKVKKPISAANDDEKELRKEIWKLEKAKQLKGSDLPTLREKLNVLHDFKEYMSVSDSLNSTDHAPLQNDIDKINAELERAISRISKPISPKNAHQAELKNEINKVVTARQVNETDAYALRDKINALDDFKEYIAKHNALTKNLKSAIRGINNKLLNVNLSEETKQNLKVMKASLQNALNGSSTAQKAAAIEKNDFLKDYILNFELNQLRPTSTGITTPSPIIIPNPFAGGIPPIVATTLATPSPRLENAQILINNAGTGYDHLRDVFNTLSNKGTIYKLPNTIEIMGSIFDNVKL